MHGADLAPARTGKERKEKPRKLVECIPGDVVRVVGGDVYCVTAVIWGTPMGRKKVNTEFGWSELHCLDENMAVADVVQWAR